MYLKNLKRKPTVIYMTFVAMIGGAGYLGFVENYFICSAIFLWWLLLAFILISRYGVRKLILLKAQQSVSEDLGVQYKPSLWKTMGVLLMIGLPFYYFWFIISFLACINGYFFILLNLPVLTLSFLAFGYAFSAWKDLKMRGWIFWFFQLFMYTFIQGLGWLVRVGRLSELYIV